MTGLNINFNPQNNPFKTSVSRTESSNPFANARGVESPDSEVFKTESKDNRQTANTMWDNLYGDIDAFFDKDNNSDLAPESTTTQNTPVKTEEQPAPKTTTTQGTPVTTEEQPAPKTTTTQGTPVTTEERPAPEARTTPKARPRTTTSPTPSQPSTPSRRTILSPGRTINNKPINNPNLETPTNSDSLDVAKTIYKGSSQAVDVVSVVADTPGVNIKGVGKAAGYAGIAFSAVNTGYSAAKAYDAMERGDIETAKAAGVDAVENAIDIASAPFGPEGMAVGIGVKASVRTTVQMHEEVFEIAKSDTDVSTKAKDLANVYVDTPRKLYNNTMDVISDTIKGFVGDDNVASDIVDMTANTFKSVNNWQFGHSEEADADMKNAGKYVDNISNRVGSYVNTTKNIANAAVGLAGQAIDEVENAATAVAKTAVRAAGNAVDEVENAATAAAKTAVRAAGNAVEGVKNTGKKVVKTAVRAAGSAVEEVENAATAAAKTAVRAAGSAVEEVKNTGKKVVKTVARAAGNAVGNAVEGAKNMVSKGFGIVRSWF